MIDRMNTANGGSGLYDGEDAIVVYLRGDRPTLNRSALSAHMEEIRRRKAAAVHAQKPDE